MALPIATLDTHVVLEAVSDLFRGLMKKGYGYKKCGGALLDLSWSENLQADLFQPATTGNEALMGTLDAIN
jgi:DNA polymerase V